MRKLAFLVAAALCFGLAPFTPRLGPVAGSVALVGLAVMLAIAASSAVSALAVAGGALGAFASGMLLVTSPAAAGAALAGTLSMSFAVASLPVRGVAMTVAAVLLALPLLVDADDPLAHALDGAATEIDGTAAAALREAAELRRTVEEDLLDAKTARHTRATWAALLRLAEARVRLSRSPAPRADGASPAEAVRKRVDERIGDHVKALARAYTAAGAAKAAEVSLDDAALRGVETEGETLEQVSRAIVDEVG